MQKIISIGNTLSRHIFGLERVWLQRAELCRRLGFEHELVILVKSEDLDKDYLEQFGRVVFISEEEGRRVDIDKKVKTHILMNKNVTVIDDNPHDALPITYNTMRLAGVNFYKFIHFDITAKDVYGEGPYNQLRKDVRYLVCNEYIERMLAQEGFDAKFHPAVFVETNNENCQKNLSKNWVLVASNNPVKNIEWALRAFEKLHENGFDRTLTIYGKPPEELVPRLEACPLITLAGTVDKVPYWLYDGYLSCSVSEAFANACVEASGYDLDLLLLNNPCHVEYLNYLQRTDCLFRTRDDLYGLLVAEREPVRSKALGERFSVEVLEEALRSLLYGHGFPFLML